VTVISTEPPLTTVEVTVVPVDGSNELPLPDQVVLLILQVGDLALQPRDLARHTVDGIFQTLHDRFWASTFAVAWSYFCFRTSRAAR
jgi:hypothetical protein